MIFYLTGPDHSGKTTLANYLIRSRKANYIHSTYNKDWNLEDYHDDIGQMALTLNNYGQNIVLDRWCLDAYPYRFVNKGNTYDPKYLWNQFVHDIDDKSDLILIFCLPADEFDPCKREEMFNSNEMKVVEKEFYDMFNQIGHYTYFYKTDGSDMEGFINHIIECQKNRPIDYEWKNNDDKTINVKMNVTKISKHIPRIDFGELEDHEIEFHNYGNNEEDYLKQEIDLDKELEKDIKGYHEYLAWFYKNQKEQEDKFLEKANKTGKHFKDISEIKTTEYNGVKYKIRFYSNNREADICELIGKHGKDEDFIDHNSELYLNILKKCLKENDKGKKTVDEKSIDYDKLPIVIAVDFDGTLVKNAFPKIVASDENINWDLINKLKDEKKNGKKLVLWTNRTGQALDDAVTFSNEVLGLVFDAINDNVKEVKEVGLDPRKIWFTETYDDKAINIKF